MESSFEMACTEVLEILKLLPREEYMRIPKNAIEFLESKKDISYKFEINEEFQLGKISKKANAIIVVLWEKYFASESQKQKLHTILRQNYNEQERKKEQYNYEILFDKPKEDEKISLIPIEKEKWYEKIYKFLKYIFSHKNTKGGKDG